MKLKFVLWSFLMAMFVSCSDNNIEPEQTQASPQSTASTKGLRVIGTSTTTFSISQGTDQQWVLVNVNSMNPYNGGATIALSNNPLSQAGAKFRLYYYDSGGVGSSASSWSSVAPASGVVTLKLPYRFGGIPETKCWALVENNAWSWQTKPISGSVFWSN